MTATATAIVTATETAEVLSETEAGREIGIGRTETGGTGAETGGAAATMGDAAAAAAAAVDVTGTETATAAGTSVSRVWGQHALINVQFGSILERALHCAC